MCELAGVGMWNSWGGVYGLAGGCGLVLVGVVIFYLVL